MANGNESFIEKVRKAWNVFRTNDPPIQNEYRRYYDYGLSSSYRPDRKRLTIPNERSIIASIYNRIAIDVSAVSIKHVRIDINDIYVETIWSSLHDCLNVEANIDQTGREFIMDVVMSMFDEGCVAIVPVDTSIDYLNANSFEILSMRVGKITNWYPRHVRIELYNDRVGRKEEITLPKEKVAIIENPLYSVMNEPNSTLKRLINKLNILDMVDEQNGSSKLDLIIQLPYSIKSKGREELAKQRRQSIEDQLVGSKYGIAYIDSTEHITQLNRPAENNLLNQVEYLTRLLYSQLGMTQEIFDGTANEQMLLNYYNRTIEPILSAITDEMKRKFLTKTARTQGQSIEFFRDPFRLVPVVQIAQMADAFSRNEILTGNEIRSIVGYKPHDDPSANELRNKNMPVDLTGTSMELVNEALEDSNNSLMDDLEGNQNEEGDNYVQ